MLPEYPGGATFSDRLLLSGTLRQAGITGRVLLGFDLRDPLFRALLSLPSRPGESHPEPLTDPYVNLSIHTARATL
jgi:hypothetical protein